MDDSAVYAVELSMDEACTNVIEHAYEGKDGGDIECTCDTDEKNLTIIIHDHGKSFDPASIVPPDLNADLDARPVGGLGIFLMKRLMDEVRFEPMGDAGNILTMIKHRKIDLEKNKSARPPSAWKQVIALGEELMRATSLSAQPDLIIATTETILGCKANLWLDGRLFRLPGINQVPLFPEKPPNGQMHKAVSSGKTAFSEGNKTTLAVPLKNGDLAMGSLQVERLKAHFTKKEIELLEGLAGHISLALVASHRFAIEQWRIEQLTLVRRVSAQIANVLDLDKLSKRVTKLIQRTFHYYYVAIFTLGTRWESPRLPVQCGTRKRGRQADKGPFGGRIGGRGCTIRGRSCRK